jgi:hemoglobin-like flavoprotein
VSSTAEILNDSLAYIVERHPDITPRFYEILFARYPQVQPLFSRRAPELQQKMLQEAIVAAVQHADDPTWITSNLRGMGVTHQSYGVTVEMYDWVGECLLATLAELAGEQWTPAVAKAWTDTYGALASTMLDGARNAEA